MIDASDCDVLPGAIDTHVHVSMPSGPAVTVDDYASATAAAATGGTTTIVDFATQQPGEPVRAAFESWRERMDSAWGLSFVCRDAGARSHTGTAFRLPEGVADADVRAGLLERFGVAFGGGLGSLSGRCVRVGHLGDVDELMIIGPLTALELGLPAYMPIEPVGVAAAVAALGA